MRVLWYRVLSTLMVCATSLLLLLMKERQKTLKQLLKTKKSPLNLPKKVHNGSPDQ